MRTMLRLIVPALVAASCGGDSTIPVAKPSPPSILHETPADPPAPAPAAENPPPETVPAPTPAPK